MEIRFLAKKTNFSVKRKLKLLNESGWITQKTFTSSESTIETLEKGVWFKTPERPLLQKTSSFLILSEGIGRCSDVFVVKFEIISKKTIGNPAFCLALYLTPLIFYLIFNWFSRRVKACWQRQWAKNQVSTNQNSRNRWCQVVRQTVC